MPSTKPPYPAEFRQQMVELVHAGRTPAQLAREFDVTAQSISSWVAQAAADSGKPARGKDVLSTVEREELARLRRENKQLKLERDILARLKLAWPSSPTSRAGTTRAAATAHSDRSRRRRLKGNTTTQSKKTTSPRKAAISSKPLAAGGRTGQRRRVPSCHARNDHDETATARPSWRRGGPASGWVSCSRWWSRSPRRGSRSPPGASWCHR